MYLCEIYKINIVNGYHKHRRTLQYINISYEIHNNQNNIPKLGFINRVKFDHEGHGQSSRKTTGTISKLVYIFCPNLMVLAWICGELWHGQAQNGVNLAFQVKFDLEGQGQLPPKNNSDLNQIAPKKQ